MEIAKRRQNERNLELGATCPMAEGYTLMKSKAGPDGWQDT
jgi:hypothetical protein